MTYVNPLRATWSAGRPTFSAWLSSGEPLIGEYLAGCGYDEVLADLQHGAIEIGHLPALFQAIESRGRAPAARVAANDYTLIGRVLDMGALAIVVPMVESGEEAAAAVAAERERISVELHDIIAHSVSAMVVQAGSARLLLRTDRERARESLSAIERTGRDTLTDLRSLLGMLRRQEAQ